MAESMARWWARLTRAERVAAWIAGGFIALILALAGVGAMLPAPKMTKDEERRAGLRAAKGGRLLDRLVAADHAAGVAGAARDAETKKADLETARRVYPYTKKNFFLDRGLDIEIEVTGEHAEKVEFQYIFAGPVLGRRFETSGLIGELRSLGFSYVVLKDEHVYFQSWDLRPPEVQEAEEEARRAEARRKEAEKEAKKEEFRRRMAARYVEDKKYLAEWLVRYRIAAEDIRGAIRSLTTIGPGATGCQRLRLAVDANRDFGSPPDSALASDSSRAMAAARAAIVHCERGDADGTRVDITQAMMLLDKVDFRLNALGMKK